MKLSVKRRNEKRGNQASRISAGVISVSNVKISVAHGEAYESRKPWRRRRRHQYGESMAWHQWRNGIKREKMK